ncbi:hypothetical protein B0H14DRAFT_2595423 [Mycena olivaceomarginata]|nr:hypothetical protein B0H14DRAFT_2595423 [Mycena olivaceomarginata]
MDPSLLSTGTVLIDHTTFPVNAQGLVKRLYTVPDLVCHNCAKHGFTCRFIRWSYRCYGCREDGLIPCLFESQAWWQFTYPASIEPYTFDEPSFFKEIWHELSLRDLTPSLFSPGFSNARPSGLIARETDYIRACRNVKLLHGLTEVYHAQGREFMRSQAYFLWDAYRYASTEPITPDAIIGPQTLKCASLLSAFLTPYRVCEASRLMPEVDPVLTKLLGQNFAVSVASSFENKTAVIATWRNGRPTGTLVQL